MIQLFRVLLPSWKFFDRVVAVPSLWVRYSKDGKTFGEWVDRLPGSGKRDWGRLFLNSRENELFAAHSLLSQFAEDPSADASLELVARLAIRGLVGDPEPLGSRGALELQFKVTAAGSELYLSDPIECHR